MLRRSLLIAFVSVLATVGTTVRPADAAPPPLISVHGDSIAAQSAPNLRNRLQRLAAVRLDVTERAVIADKLPGIRVTGRNGRVVAVVLVLGAGDANNRHGDGRMRREIRQTLDALRGVPCVRWLNLKIAGVNGFYRGYVDRADDFNRILGRQVRDYPNARVVGYRRWAANHPGAFKADGLHHTARGKARFAQWVAEVVDRCPSV